jgi:hypothetical protein
MSTVAEEHRALQDSVARFVERELMPLEATLLAREAAGGELHLAADETAPLLEKCRQLGLIGLDAPAEMGGADLPAVALMGVQEELSRTIVPFSFPPESPVLRLLIAVANDEQRRRYLEPYAQGLIRSATAISEPGAGADPAAMTTRAVKEGNSWVLNGRKIWTSYMPAADFTVVLARTAPGKDHRGITAFLVDRDTPGLRIERETPMLGGHRTYELVFEDCRVPDAQVLGEPGSGFANMQLRPHPATAAHGADVHRHGAPCARHDGRARQPAQHLRRQAGRTAGGAVVGRRRGDGNTCLPADGARRGGQAGCRWRRAHGGLNDQGVRNRDGDPRNRPRHAGVRCDGRGKGDAAAADGAEGADDASLRGARPRSIAW